MKRSRFHGSRSLGCCASTRPGPKRPAAGIVSIDLFVVRTISFKLLSGLIVLWLVRRRLVSISVTNNRTVQSDAQYCFAITLEGSPLSAVAGRYL